MVQTYLSRTSGEFYCMYVDFKMAFDQINHAKLFESLLNKGVDGNFLTFYLLCKIFYITCNVGTRQVVISSPIICSLSIN